MNRCLISFALASFPQPLFARSRPRRDRACRESRGHGERGVDHGRAELDRLWNRMGAKMRAQYDKGGNGKLRFLENYVGKRLLLQKAVTVGLSEVAGRAGRARGGQGIGAVRHLRARRGGLADRDRGRDAEVL